MHASIGPSCALADYRGRASPCGQARRTRKACASTSRDSWNATKPPSTSSAWRRPDATAAIAPTTCGRRPVAFARGGPAGAGAALACRRTSVGAEGLGQVVDVTGTVSSRAATRSAMTFVSRYPSNDAPLLALAADRRVARRARVFEMGDRTAVSPYSSHRRFDATILRRSCVHHGFAVCRRCPTRSRTMRSSMNSPPNRLRPAGIPAAPSERHTRRRTARSGGRRAPAGKYVAQAGQLDDGLASACARTWHCVRALRA